MVNRKVEITETVLRDGQQSLIATRMPIADMLPIFENNGSGWLSCARSLGWCNF